MTVSEDIRHKYYEFQNEISEKYEQYAWNVLGEQMEELLDYYSSVAVSGLVAESLRELFTKDTIQDWVDERNNNSRLYIRNDACVSKLISAVSADNLEFYNVIKESKESPYWDDMCRGFYGYIGENYERIRFLVANNLVKNGYTDEYIEAYAEKIEDGYVRDVMNDKKNLKPEEINYDIDRELHSFRDYVGFYERLDKLKEERDDKSTDVNKDENDEHDK